MAADLETIRVLAQMIGVMDRPNLRARAPCAQVRQGPCSVSGSVELDFVVLLSIDVPP